MNTWAILYIINVGFLALLMAVHFRFTKKDIQANRLFTALLFALAYQSFIMFLFATKWILDLPHFGRTGTFALYSIYPLAYLYLRNLLGQEKLKWFDLIHLLPILIYTIDFAEYFLQSAEIKRQQMQLDFSTQNIYIAQSPRLFPKQFHFRFRALLSTLYILLSVITWVKVFYSQKQEEIKTENRSIMQWTFTLCILLVIGVIPGVVVDLFNIPLDLVYIQNASLYVATFSFALFLFFKPDIVYGVKGLWVEEPVKLKLEDEKLILEDADKVELSIKKTYLKEETVETMAAALQEYLVKDKAFLRNSFSITELSIAIGYPTHQVSAYLNNHLDMNFNEYINSQRINYLLDQLTENPDWRMFTLESLGQKVGFNNRYTFLNAFKKLTGETPSVYLKKFKTV